MCAFKKPSTPSYGVKLFVSLVLLAISLCLVNCAVIPPAATTVPADEVPLSIPKTEVASKLTTLVGSKGNKKFSEHNPSYDAKDAFPTTVAVEKPKFIPAVSGSASAKFEVLLPVDKTAAQYIDEVVKPFSPAFADKSLAKIEEELKKELEKDAHTLVPGAPVTFNVEKNFKEFETILGNNFEFDASTPLQLIKKSTPATGLVTDAGKVLFEHVFSGTTPKFDPIVYTLKTDAATLVSDCVTAANSGAATTAYTDADNALAILLTGILGELKESTATSVNPVAWSDVVKEIVKVGFEIATKISDSPASSKFFLQSDILLAKITTPENYYDKFYLKFVDLKKIGSKSNDELFIKYLAANIDASVKDNAATGYPALVANTFNSSFADKKNIYDPAVTPTGADDFHHVVSEDISKLIAAIDTKLGDYSLLTFVEGDIAPSAGPFTAPASNLECAKFPVAKPATGTAAATIAEFEKYVKSISFTPTATDDATIKKEFLTSLWAQASLDAYKATLTTTPTVITPPVGGTTTTTTTGGAVETTATTSPITTGETVEKTGENSDKEKEKGSDDEDSTESEDKQEAQNKDNTSGGAESKSDYMWIVWTVAGIFVVAIFGGVGYFFWMRKKNASNL